MRELGGLRKQLTSYQPRGAAERRVGWRFIILVYAAAYTGTWIALLTPPDEAAINHSVVLSVGAFFALANNPFFGRLSDRTTSRCGMRRSASSPARSSCNR